MRNVWKRLTATLLALAVVVAMVPGQRARAASDVTQKGCKPTSITIQWNVPSTSGGTVDNYKVYAGKDYSSRKLVATLPPDQTTYTLKKLKPGAVRYLEVGYDYTYDSGYQGTDRYLGAISSAKTTPCAVTGVKEKYWYHALDEVNIAWKAIPSATGYQYRFFKNNGKTKAKGTTNYGSSVTASCPKVTETEVYTAKVRAFTEVNGKKYYGDWSGAAYLIPQPQVSKMTRGKNKLTVKWGRVSGATSYVIYMSTNKNAAYNKYKKIKTIKATKKDKKAITATVKKKLSKDKTYYVYVQAIKKVKKKNYKSVIYNAWYNI